MASRGEILFGILIRNSTALGTFTRRSKFTLNAAQCLLQGYTSHVRRNISARGFEYSACCVELSAKVREDGCAV